MFIQNCLGLHVPNWPLIRLSHGFRRIGSGTTPPSDDFSLYGGTTNWVTTSELRETRINSAAKQVSDRALQAYSALKVYPPGTLLVAMYGATIGRLAILDIPACTNQACCALADSLRIEARFAFYWLLAGREHLLILADGGGQPNINQETIRALRVALPPPHTQRAIADFLDKKTAAIDALIAKKERLIELLQEKRQALITQAVTKGLDPNVPMKDSGVEWLGEIPAHWVLKRLSRVVKGCAYGVSESLLPSGRVAVLRMNNLQDGRLDLAELKFLEDYPSELLLRKDDVVYNRTNSWALVGKAALVAESNVQNPTGFASYLVRLRFNKSLSASYACSLFNSSWFLAQARAHAVPAISQANLSASQYVALPVVVPPLREQQAIAERVRDFELESQRLLAAIGHQVQMLAEYRQALITDAVTGKLDIPVEPE